LHNDLVLSVWDAKVEDDQVQLGIYSDLAASGIEVDTCGRKHWKINQENYCSLILIKMYFCINSKWE